MDKALFSVNRATSDGLDVWCKPCRKEYSASKRQRKTEEMYRDDFSKECRKCRKVVHIHWFRSGDRESTYCKGCRQALGSAHNLKKKGLSVDQYIKMETDRNGLCDACGRPEMDRKRLSVDHDHSCCPGQESCGKCVRGLLCFRCNTALGLLKDDVSVLESLTKYLRQSL